VEGLVPSDDIRVKLTYKDAGGAEQATDEVHFKVVARNLAFLARPMHEGAYVVPEERIRYRTHGDNGRYTYANGILLRRVIDNFVNGGKPVPVQNRNMVAKVLINGIQGPINPQIALVKGVVMACGTGSIRI